MRFSSLLVSGWLALASWASDPSPSDGRSSSNDKTCTARSEPTTSLCLNMMVKDEGKDVQRAIESVLPHINAWIVCDTGSTGALSTPASGERPSELQADLCFALERRHGIPRHVHFRKSRRPWKTGSSCMGRFFHKQERVLERRSTIHREESWHL